MLTCRGKRSWFGWRPGGRSNLAHVEHQGTTTGTNVVHVADAKIVKLLGGGFHRRVDGGRGVADSAVDDGAIVFCAFHSKQ